MKMRPVRRILKKFKKQRSLVLIVIITLIWCTSVGISVISSNSLDYVESEPQLEIRQVDHHPLPHSRHISSVDMRNKWLSDVKWGPMTFRSLRHLQHARLLKREINSSSSKNALARPVNTRKPKRKSRLKQWYTTLPKDSGSGDDDDISRHSGVPPLPSPQPTENATSVPAITFTMPVNNVTENFTKASDQDYRTNETLTPEPETTTTILPLTTIEATSSTAPDITSSTEADITSSSSTEVITTVEPTTVSPCNLPTPTLQFPKGRLKPYQFRVKWTPSLSSLNATHIVYRKCESGCDKPKIVTGDSTDEPAVRPCTKYRICIAAYYDKCGLSDEVCDNIVTPSRYPPMVVNLTAACGKESARIQWDVRTDNCVTKEVILNIKEDGGKEIESPRNTTENFADISDLSPYTTYIFGVLIMNIGNVTSSLAATNCTTPPSKPSKISQIFEPVLNIESTVLSWAAPEKPNGKLEWYQVVLVGQIYNKDNNTCNEISKTSNSSESNVTFNDLCGGSDYNLTIQAKNENVTDLGEEAYYNFTMEAVPPRYSNKTADAGVDLHPSEKKSQVKVYFSKCFYSNKNGNISQYDIIVSDSHHAHETIVTGTWKTSHKTYDVHSYFATPSNWTPQTNPGDEKWEFTIGADANCQYKPETERCNGPLRAGTNYSIRIRAYNSAGFGDSISLYIVTDPDEAQWIIVTSVTIILAILLIIALVVVLKRNKFLKSQYYQKFGWFPKSKSLNVARPMQIQATNKPILISEFEDNYKKMTADACLKFAMEFEELSYVSPKCPTTAAQLDENRPKNRWINILPFDHSRVKLLPIADDAFTDYINASYIPGYKSQREYIASQGPLPNTKDDFWRMIWEQNSPMIVMLTQCVERGKPKCEEYWPTDKDVHYYGDLAVRLQSESILTDYNLRIFELQLGSRTTEVKQMHFTMWPDFGCPENTSLLLNFVQSVQNHMPHETTGPMVVHCSAGVGRTGTFLAVDKLQQHIAEHDYVDIYGTVREMRHYRSNMVQTEDQYIYIHECIKDLLNERKHKSSTSTENEYETVSLVSHASTSLSTDQNSLSTSKTDRTSDIEMICLTSGNGIKGPSSRNTVI